MKTKTNLKAGQNNNNQNFASAQAALGFGVIQQNLPSGNIQNQ